MGGLKIEIADGIRLLKPKTVKEAMNLAIKEQLSKQRRTNQFGTARASVIPNATSNNNSQVGAKRLSWDEMRKRRAQGLCFNCYKKFTMGHRCQGPKLMMLEGPNYDGDSSLVLEPEEEEPGITLHALTGWTCPNATRIEAMTGSHKLINCSN